MNTISPNNINEHNLPFISGFYPTPATVIELMINEVRPFYAHDSILEPSAGRGDIADRIRLEGVEPFVIEPHPQLAAILRAKGYEVFEDIFEKFKYKKLFTKVIMNPPFADTLDFQHIRQAFSLLEPGGVLVSLLTDGEDDAQPIERAAFADWALSTANILRIKKIPLDLYQGKDVFRTSIIPKRMITMIKPI